jgi:hypothetical protein
MAGLTGLAISGFTYTIYKPLTQNWCTIFDTLILGCYNGCTESPKKWGRCEEEVDPGQKLKSRLAGTFSAGVMCT